MLCIDLSICLCVCMSVGLSVCLCVCMSVGLSVCLCVCMSVCLSLCLSASGCVVVLVLVLGGCLLALCLSAFVSVCLLLCGCARNPSKSWGRPCDILGRNAGAILGIFGASALTNAGGPSGIVWGTLGQNCEKGLGRP